MSTPRFAFPYIQASQAQKEVTHNEALLMVDALVSLSLEDRHLSAPPVSPQNGQVWFINGAGSGAWNGQSSKLAHYDSGQWYFYVVPDGLRAWIKDEAGYFVYSGGSWSAFVGSGQFITVASVSASYAVQASDRGKLLAVNANTAAVEVRLPNAATIGNGFPFTVKKTDSSGNAVTLRAAQNLLTQSQQLDNAAWTKTRVTVTANYAAAPDGTTTADRVLETTDNGVHEIKQAYSKPAGVTILTAAVRLKADGRTEAYLMLDDGTATNRAQIRANLSTGAVPFTDNTGTYTLLSNSVISLGSGWYLLRITVSVPTGAGSVTHTVRLYNAGTSYVGDTVLGVQAWGMQLQEGSLLGEYLETIASGITQSIDGLNAQNLTTQNQAVQIVSDGANWLITAKA
ncbi:MAG: DUF2793 domain-containing protein [Holosporales bacterium]